MKWNNDDIFIEYNNFYILIYQKINGTKNYQLLSNFKLCKYYYNDIITQKLLKLDSKTLMLSNNIYIYLFNIKKMNFCQKLNFIRNYSNIIFIIKKENNFYIYKYNNLYIFKFFKNMVNFIKLIKEKELIAFNYLLNLNLNKNYSDLKLNIKIICVKNLPDKMLSFKTHEENMIALSEEKMITLKAWIEKEGEELNPIHEKEMKLIEQQTEIERNKIVQILKNIPEKKEKNFYKSFKMQKYNKYNRKGKSKKVINNQKNYKKNYR